MNSTFLINTPGFPAEHARKLATYGVGDVNQLISLAAIHETHRGICRTLGIPSNELDSLVDMVRIKAPQTGAYLDPTPSDKLMLGLEVDRGCRATAYGGALFNSTNLPSKINHIPELGPVKNQGQRGTCVAFGSLASLEFATGKLNLLSEQFLYWGCKKRDGHSGSGTYIETAMEFLEDIGVCYAKDHRYNSVPIEGDEGQKDPSAKAMKKAFYNSIISKTHYAKGDINSLKEALAGTIDGKPRLVTCGIFVFPSMGNASTRETGTVVMPFDGERGVGGHCICLVGYVDAPEAPGGGWFIFRNSWGEEWAPKNKYESGYGLLPYAYMKKYGHSSHTIETPSTSAIIAQFLRETILVPTIARGVLAGVAALLIVSAFFTGLLATSNPSDGQSYISAGDTKSVRKHNLLSRNVPSTPYKGQVTPAMLRPKSIAPKLESISEAEKTSLLPVHWESSTKIRGEPLRQSRAALELALEKLFEN